MFLETIREFAAHMLADSGEAGVLRRRHAQWFMELTEQAEKQLRGPDQIAWLDRLEEEIHNIRAVLIWSMETPGEIEAGLRVAGALYWFWNTRAHFSDEGRAWLDRLLSTPTSAEESLSARRARAKALLTAGWLHSFLPDRDRAVALTESSLTLFREVEAGQGVAAALTNLGVYAYLQGRIPRAMALAEEALAWCRSIGDRFWIAQVLNDVLGPIAAQNKDYGRAIVLQTEALALRRVLGDIDGIAWSLYQLGGLARAQSDFDHAQACYEESRTLSRQINNSRLHALAVDELGQIALAQCQYSQAQVLFEECLAVYEFLNEKEAAARTLIHLDRAVRRQGDTGLAIIRQRDDNSAK